MSEIINITGPSPLTIVNNAIQRGSNAPWLNSFSGKYSPTSGWSFNQKFSGLSFVQMQNLAYLYSQSGCSYTISYENGKATLETEDNRGNVTIDTWEIGINRVNKGWLQNPKLITLLKSIAGTYTGSSDTDVINYNVLRFQNILGKGIENNQQPFAVPNPDVTPPQDPGTIDCVFSYQNFFNKADPTFTFANISPAIYLPLFRMYQMALRGQDSFLFDQYCLRHTTNASNRGYYNVADTNVNYIYTYSHFISEITNSGYWIFPAPAEILGALSVIFSSFPTAEANFMQGALKGGSPRQTTANNRVNIETEYALDIWSTDFYSTF